MKVSDNFDASVWKGHQEYVTQGLLAHAAYWEARRPRGILHEPNPAQVRQRLRLVRRRRLKWRLQSWWYDVRAPLRRLGGCVEEER